MTTMKERLAHIFFERHHLSWEDTQACMDFAIKGVLSVYRDRLASLRADLGSDVEGAQEDLAQVEACWDREYTDYPLEWRMNLENEVTLAALPWCINRINTLKATLAEIQRLSSAALPHEPQKEEIDHEWLESILKDDNTPSSSEDTGERTGERNG
jgi:hypothetical protein